MPGHNRMIRRMPCLILSSIAAILFLLLYVKVLALSANSACVKSTCKAVNSQVNSYTALLPLVANHSSSITWTRLNFAGARVTDILFDRDATGHALASVYTAGLFVTWDSGTTWIHNPAMLGRTNDLAMHPLTPTMMYLALLGSAGVYWSTDMGETWEAIPGWPYLPGTMLSVAVHPVSPTVLLAGAATWEVGGGEIYKSVNGGNSWRRVSVTGTNAVIFTFDPISPSLIYAGTRFWGVMKSTNSGDTWQTANSGLPISGSTSLQVSALLLSDDLPYEIYAATSAGLFASNNEAETWDPVWPGIYAGSIESDPEDPSILYLGTDDGIFMSLDGGSTWIRLAPCGTGTIIRRMAFEPYTHHQRRLWAATYDGIWVCQWGGTPHTSN